MNRPGFSRFPAGHHLDPDAQEFFPKTNPAPPNIYYAYPPNPLPYDHIGYARPHFPPPHPYVTAVADPAPPSSPPPSRTLLLSMVPTSVSESAVRRELEVFGDVRAVQMERRREGLVTVHFYDVRDAQAALAAVQGQHMQHQYRLGLHYEAVLNSPVAFAAPPPPPPRMARGLILGHVVWAQFATPVTSGIPDGNNQGTLVVFNLEPVVSAAYLRQIFEAFGPVKELRETPSKRNQRFVEFYDVRCAAKAMSEMKGKEIYGRAIVVEYSRPGGQCKKFLRGHPLSNKCNSLTPPASSNNNWPRNGGSWSSGSSSPKTNLSIGGGGGNEIEATTTTTTSRPPQRKNNIGTKKTTNNANGACEGGGLKQANSGSRQWKFGAGGRRERDDHDPRFLIKEDAIVDESNCWDPRTTVMIKNIPNKYSQKLLLNMLDNHCIHCNEQIAAGEEDKPPSSYDFVYLPIDFINKCNVGYGFVNMTSPQATLRLYKAFHHQNWEVFNSRKICQVTYARLQGLEALREHFKNSKFPDDSESSSMPVVFSPPRDGCALSEPVPICGCPEGANEDNDKDKTQL